MAGPLHLARRFFGSLVPLGVRRDDLLWARSHLSDAEWRLWVQLSRADRRHAVGVARRVQRAEPEAPDWVAAAALTHDIGKLDARLGTYGRVVATLSAKAVGRDDEVLRAWARAGGFTRKVGLYLRHPDIGGDHLALGGSVDEVVAWAREHHLPEAEWTVPVQWGRVLKAADDD